MIVPASMAPAQERGADRIVNDVRFTGLDGTLLTKADDLDPHKSGAQLIHRVDEALQVLAVGDTGIT